MVSPLAWKLLRDLRRQRVRFLAVSTTIFLGVLLFTASYGAYGNLKGSYEATFERLRFPDLWVRGGDLDGFVAAAGTEPAVAAVEFRGFGAVSIRVTDGRLLRGQALTLPDSGEPEVGRVLLDSGRPLGAGPTCWPSVTSPITLTSGLVTRSRCSSRASGSP